MSTPRTPERYQRILRDWPPAPVTDAQGRAGLGGFGGGLRAKAEAVQRGERPQDDLLTAGSAVRDVLPEEGLAAGGALAGLAGAAALLAPVIIGIVGLFALTGGGPAGLLKGARCHAYNFARAAGNVQPWLELRRRSVRYR